MPARVVQLQTGFSNESVAIVERRELAVLDALSLLIPSDLDGERKARFGAAGEGAYALGDGSYVLVDRCRPTQDVLSFGVGSIVSFELAMAERGHRVFLYDHTIDALPTQHERFVWIPAGICAKANVGDRLFTLEHYLRQLIDLSTDPILKIDVEGAEWEVLAEAPAHVLRHFEQIALEVHNLNRLDEPAFNTLARAALGNLADHFTLCHVHANNYGFVHLLAGSLPMPETLELTYVRSDVVRPMASTTLYPTDIDLPNYRTLTDLRLWFYPFMPGSEKAPRTLPSPG
jgi:hypothetical protein